MGTVRRTGRVLEKTWDCTWCGAKNRGRDRECVSCGRPKDAAVRYNNEHIAVLDGEAAKEYLKGPDWLCDYCGSYSPADKSNCVSCGAARGKAKTYFKVQEEQEQKEAEARSMGQDMAGADTGRPSSVRGTVLGRLTAVLSVLGILGVSLLLIWFFFWLATPKQVSGTVTGLTWKTSITLEELRTLQGEGWEVPYDAWVVGSESRYYGTEQEFDHYELQSVPVTKYRTVQDADLVWYTYEDLGNGFDEEIEHRMEQSHEEPYTDYEEQYIAVYVDVDVYADWYWYEYERWMAIETSTAEGIKGEEYDPVLVPSGDYQRVTDLHRSYKACVEGDDGTYEVPVTKELYDSLRVGDSVLLEVYKIGAPIIKEVLK